MTHATLTFNEQFRGSRRMMINCPKCGFSQPKDRYCASCGVDMVTYQPADPTISDRLKTNWIIQVAVFLLIVIGGYLYYREQSVPTLEERIASIEEAPQSRSIEDLSTPSNEKPQAVTAQPEPVKPQPPALAAPAENADPNLAAKPDGGSASGASAAQPTSAAVAVPDSGRGFMHATEETLSDQPTNNRSDGAVSVQRLKIRFTEVKQPFASELSRSTRNLANSGTAGTIVDLPARLQEASRAQLLRDLDSANDSPVRINQPIIVFKGTRDEATESNLGITVQLTPVANDEQGVQLQVEVLSTLREPGAATPAEKNFQETFVIPKNGGVFMNGILPRRQLDADEKRVYAASPVLRVMNSSSFQNSNTDFVIFIEAK